MWRGFQVVFSSGFLYKWLESKWTHMEEVSKLHFQKVLQWRLFIGNSEMLFLTSVTKRLSYWELAWKENVNLSVIFLGSEEIALGRSYLYQGRRQFPTWHCQWRYAPLERNPSGAENVERYHFPETGQLFWFYILVGIAVFYFHNSLENDHYLVVDILSTT